MPSSCTIRFFSSFLAAVSLLFLSLMASASGQTLGSSGTIQGTVFDPSGATVKGVSVEIRNPVTGYDRVVSTDEDGHFEFTDVPFNPYHLSLTAEGFQVGQQDVSVRTSVPIDLKIALQIATAKASVTVEGEAGDLVEQTPTAHTDIDRNLIKNLTVENSSVGLSQVITNAAPGVAADANGFFHPLGDHAQASISLDNQPINDQYSKLFSNQLAINTLQSMEIITGAPPAEYGDKTTMVINANTRCGMGNSKPTGSLSGLYGSFGNWDESFTLGAGGSKWGNFLALNSTGSRRFLDSPEFSAFHDKGNGENAFDRIDFNPTSADTLHLNLFAARSWFQIPNTYDQLAVDQDQHQQIRTLNIAPGWTHLFSATTLLTFNPFFRLDHAQYFPSRNTFADLPATLGQDRRLAVMGTRADVSYSHGIHNAKAGVQFRHNILTENFDTGLTDPTFNPVCLSSNGSPVTNPSLTSPGQCAGAGFQVNNGFLPGLLRYDLTRGGRLFDFHGHTDIKEYALYAQDALTLGRFTVNLGIRGDRYRGLSRSNQIEPRVGVSYLIKRTTTLLRASYGRFLETPYNENLILSSATGVGGLATNVFGAFAAAPLQSGRRDQYNAGLEQPFGRWVVMDADYFWKHTRNAFDFDVLFSTPLSFPITWRQSKIDGIGLRVNLTSFHGFTASSVMGHTRSRFFGPENGGIIFNSPINNNVFRIDHDQVFQQSTRLQYQFAKRGVLGTRAPWVALTWRYDSGLVAGRVPDLAAALSLDGDQQAAIGFFCGNAFATLAQPITSCSSPVFGATRIRIPRPGTENDDTNPPRVAPRHLFDVGIGSENLFGSDRRHITLKLSAINVTNQDVLYNFLSTFSGTHFVTPRALQAQLGLVF